MTSHVQRRPWPFRVAEVRLSPAALNAPGDEARSAACSSSAQSKGEAGAIRRDGPASLQATAAAHTT
jgi:hypothetical protein